MITPYHPHTVGDSGVPLYMQGFPPMLSGLGDDLLLEPSTYDPGNVLTMPPDFGPSNAPIALAPSGADLGLEPSMFDPTGGLIAPANLPTNTQDIANLYASAVATGTITPAQAAAMATQAINAAGTLAKSVGPVYSPSPRVATRPPGQTAPLTASSLWTSFITPSSPGGISPAMLLGGGLVLALLYKGQR